MMPGRSVGTLVGVWCLALLALPFGCQKSVTPADAVDLRLEGVATEDPETAFDKSESAGKGVTVAVPPTGGAEAWANNCMRCHNIRRPDLRSDREWAAIVQHMRVRANLTAEEHRLILRFLQAAN